MHCSFLGIGGATVGRRKYDDPARQHRGIHAQPVSWIISHQVMCTSNSSCVIFRFDNKLLSCSIIEMQESVAKWKQLLYGVSHWNNGPEHRHCPYKTQNCGAEHQYRLVCHVYQLNNHWLVNWKLNIPIRPHQQQQTHRVRWNQWTIKMNNQLMPSTLHTWSDTSSTTVSCLIELHFWTTICQMSRLRQWRTINVANNENTISFWWIAFMIVHWTGGWLTMSSNLRVSSTYFPTLHRIQWKTRQ